MQDTHVCISGATGWARTEGYIRAHCLLHCRRLLKFPTHTGRRRRRVQLLRVTQRLCKWRDRRGNILGRGLKKSPATLRPQLRRVHKPAPPGCHSPTCWSTGCSHQHRNRRQQRKTKWQRAPQSRGVIGRRKSTRQAIHYRATRPHVNRTSWSTRRDPTNSRRRNRATNHHHTVA